MHKINKNHMFWYIKIKMIRIMTIINGNFDKHKMTFEFLLPLLAAILK